MTKDMQTQAGFEPLPLFYKDPVLLRFEEHGEAGLAPPGCFAFASEAVAIPLCLSEFALAARHYPIIFALDDMATPFALVGIKPKQNLFIERDGSWRAGSYLPAYVRRYPFIISETPDWGQRLLTVDRGSDRFLASADAQPDAQRLFDAAGKPTEAAWSIMAFCEAYRTDHLGTVAFGRALVDTGLLTPNHAQIQLPDRSQYVVNGFLAIDEKAFRTLPAQTLAEWHAKGWTDYAVLHFASRLNWQGLLDLDALRSAERKGLTQ